MVRQSRARDINGLFELTGTPMLFGELREGD
jgi:hypothetical protein